MISITFHGRGVPYPMVGVLSNASINVVPDVVTRPADRSEGSESKDKQEERKPVTSSLWV